MHLTLCNANCSVVGCKVNPLCIGKKIAFSLPSNQSNTGLNLCREKLFLDHIGLKYNFKAQLEERVMQNNLSQREHCEAFCFLEMLGSISMPETLTIQEDYTHIQKAHSPCLTTCHLCFVTWHMWLKRACLPSGGTNILGNIPWRTLGNRAEVASILLWQQFLWLNVGLCKSPSEAERRYPLPFHTLILHPHIRIR